MNTNQTPTLAEQAIIGTCSICGGAVAVPRVYWSVSTPVPECRKCGAVKKNPFGPVIDMERGK